jgi:hypothetical protein
LSKHITTEDFADHSVSSPVPYGVSRERSIAALRRLADLIEGGMVCLSAVRMESGTRHRDFSTNTLSIEFQDIEIPKE